MVALWWLLVDEEEKPREQFDLRIVWLAVGIVGVILIGAGIIALVDRWRKRPFQARMTASEQLAQFRELFDKGQIQPEEFERIRAILNERIRQEMAVGGGSGLPATGEKPAGPNTPAG
jgi:hypothetical protein